MNNYIQQQFVPYEIAKELIEIGFDKPFKLFDKTIYYINGSFSSCNDTHKEFFESEKEFVLCPLYQQVISWFREKKILIEIVPVDDWNHWGFDITGEDIMSPFYTMYSTYKVEYSSYMKAVDAAIKKAIKLCQNKK